MLSLRRSKRFRRPAPRWYGQAIIGAILNGERDPWKLAELKHDMVRASQEEVARSLEGNWREDVVFELRQAVDSFHFAHQQMQQCDRQLESFLASLPTRTLDIPSDRATAAVTQRLKKERGKETHPQWADGKPEGGTEKDLWSGSDLDWRRQCRYSADDHLVRIES